MAVMTPRPAQPTPGSGPPDSTAADAVEADADHLFRLEVLDQTFLRRHLQHRELRFRIEDEAGGVGFGIAADDENLLAHLGQRHQGILRRRRLADAALSVKGYLAENAHWYHSSRLGNGWA
jgi:hypothetical protein